MRHFRKEGIQVPTNNAMDPFPGFTFPICIKIKKNPSPSQSILVPPAVQDSNIFPHNRKPRFVQEITNNEYKHQLGSFFCFCSRKKKSFDIPRQRLRLDSVSNVFFSHPCFIFSIFLQIGSLKGYYLFHHSHVRKRSLDRSEVHHSALNTEPEVSWLGFISRFPWTFPQSNPPLSFQSGPTAYAGHWQ